MNRELPVDERLLAAIDGLGEGFVLLDDALSVIHANIAVRTVFPHVSEALSDGSDFYAWFGGVIRQENLFGEQLENFLTWFKNLNRPLSIEAAVAALGGRAIHLRAYQTSTRDILVTFSDRTPPHITDTASLPIANSEIQPERREFRYFAETMAVARAEVGDALRRVETTNRALAREVAERRALERELRRLADTDDLTGAINRRRFAKILSTDSLAATSSEHKHALLMLDIDHFKMVNDAYGHQAGDDALCALVDLCRLTLPDPFQIARIGGEEFAVLLPNTTEDMVDFLAETIRQKVDAHPFRSGHHCFNLTVSIGGTIFKERPCNPLLLLSAADSALYQAKRNGRNCVFITGRSTDTPASTTTPPTVPLGRLCDQAVVTSPLDT